MRRVPACLLLPSCLAVLTLASARADDAAYYDIRLADLRLTEGKFDDQATVSGNNWQWQRTASRPRVRVEQGEAYWQSQNPDIRWSRLDQWGNVVVRLPNGPAEVVGRIDVPRRDAAGYATVRFKIAAEQAKPAAREAFFRGKIQHYERLLADRVPGAAWFRHQVRLAIRELSDKPSADPTAVPPPVDRFSPRTDFDDTFSLVSGNRAVSENLQLDRVLPAARGTDSTPVPLSSLKGVTVKEIDWKPLLEGKSPQLDALAAYVPADQHVVFFPTFEAAMRLADEADREGTALVQVAEPQSQDVGVVERYQRQIGLRRTALGRMLGPTVIKSMALTGGDPYFRVGTDLGLVFEAFDVPTLKAALTGQIVLNTTGEKGVSHYSEQLGDVAYESWRSDDRAVCSYLASYGNVVVVTNSLAQLRRLIETHRQKTPNISSLDEYKFFRDRYKLGDAGESALAFLSDATIRRWCGPKWRIADSRRVRDLAVLAELQATHVPKLATRTVEPGPIYAEFNLSAGNDQLRLTASGVTSAALGSLTFMTPIAEMDFETVTKSEASAYERWRDGYQRNFSWAFDPIGLRFTIDDDRLAADLTIMPLIDNTEYREYIAVSQGVALKPESGDPHGAPLHAVLSINKDSERMKQLGSLAGIFAPQLKVDVLSWLGESIALYADESPVWDELAKLTNDREREELLREKGYNVPIAVRFEVSSAFKATAFLAALRAFIDQVGPGMTLWETKQHGDQAYVKISPTRNAVRAGQPEEKLAAYYALTAEALTISLNEDVIKASLDRAATRTAATAGGNGEKPAAAAIAKKQPWLGENLCIDVGARAIQAFALIASQGYQAQMQRLSWGNLPILNEWRRMFPQEDPVELHERLWGVRLVCPGGGEYKWNESWQTLESTVYGHPGEPKQGPAAPPQLARYQRAAYGLTFEPQGLRAKAEVLRAK
jgi:hypothetical protein